MQVKKFELVFSLYSHPLFGVMAEPYLIQLLENGQLSLSFQKVGEENVTAFLPEVSAHEIKLIKLLSRLSNQFLTRELKTTATLLEKQLRKLADAKDEKGKQQFEYLKSRLYKTKEDFFRSLTGSERLFESGKDGYPAFREVRLLPGEYLRMKYLFMEGGIRVEPNFSDERLRGQFLNLLDERTPFALAGNFIIPVPAGLKPSRLKPFSQKQFLEIQPPFSAEFARKIILPDLQAGLAMLEGDAVKEEFPLEKAELFFSFQFEGVQLGVFSAESAGKDLRLPSKLEISLSWFYGKWKSADSRENNSSWVYEEGEKPVFRLLKRNWEEENELRNSIENHFGLTFSNGKALVSFPFLRDFILEKLSLLPKNVSYRFSPEFGQLSLKKSRLRYDVFEKINYFQIEGKIDWEHGVIDFQELKSKFLLEDGWLRYEGKYIPVEEDDQLFLEQLMLMSSGKTEIKIPRNAAMAVKSSDNSVFSSRWNRITSLLAEDGATLARDISAYSPEFTLREYQRKGIDWFIRLSSNRFGGILADDMGLGKTFQAAGFLRYLKECGEKNAALIIVPSTLLFNWRQELSRFSPDFRVCMHTGSNRAQDLRALVSYFDVILVSYQTLLRDVEIFTAHTFHALIADEAQHLKNPATAAYQAIKRLEAKNVFLLTGTPMQNSPADLWSLSEICNPGLLSSKIKPGSLQKNENPQRFQKNLELMQALVRPFMLRRTKESVLSELPEKTVSVLYCGMGEEQEIEYLACNQFISSELNDLAPGQKNGYNVRILKALTTLRQMANHPALLNPDYQGRSGKFELVTEKLQEVLSEGRKVLIFSSFVRHLQLLEMHIKEKQITYAMLTGQTVNRKAEVDKFRQQTDCSVFLISLKAGGFGLNLVEASTVFLLDPWWNPAAESQAMDRVHRIGQKDRVTVYKFITANTVEEKILQLQEQKSSMNAQLFGEGNEMDSGGMLSIEMLQSILFTKV